MTPLLESVGLQKHFALRRGSWLHAVDGVTFTIGEGESVGLVGESGCGKSTLARLVTRTLDPTDGDLIFRGRNIGFIPARAFAGTPFRPKIQMVFQDASDSLDPRYTAFRAIAEPAALLSQLRGKLLERAVLDAAAQVGLPSELLSRYPHQLSGGQKARVGIARAIVTRPDLLVLDEPTAALDVSVQATILRLLAELKGRLGLAQGATDELLVQIEQNGRTQLASGNQLFEVSGFVRNETDEALPVPPLNARLRSLEQKVVYSWTIPISPPQLAPGATATFNSANLDVPADAACLELYFDENRKFGPCRPISAAGA